MNYQFFNKCNSIDDARIQYIALAKEYHPDKNPDMSEAECNNITAKINIEYKKVLSDLEKRKEAPKPTNDKPKKPKPHKSPVNDFYSIQQGKTNPTPKKKKFISRKQAKSAIDLFYDGLKLFNDIRK